MSIVATGDLLEEQRLAPALHQLSIRHLAIAAGDTVVFGCQYRGPEEDAPALVGFHRRGETPVIVEAPAETQIGLRNYVGSVAADSAGAIVAASAPKGGLVTYWDVAGRRFLGASDLNDGCGLAPTHRSAQFSSDERRGVARHGRCRTATWRASRPAFSGTTTPSWCGEQRSRPCPEAWPIPILTLFLGIKSGT